MCLGRESEDPGEGEGMAECVWSVGLRSAPWDGQEAQGSRAQSQGLADGLRPRMSHSAPVELSLVAQVLCVAFHAGS